MHFHFNIIKFFQQYSDLYIMYNPQTICYKPVIWDVPPILGLTLFNLQNFSDLSVFRFSGMNLETNPALSTRVKKLKKRSVS